MSMHLVHFDIAQIQSYVFGSNKLDHHIGGSMLVAELLDRHLRAVGTQLFGEWWEITPKEFLDEQKGQALCILASGGNALVLCREEARAKELVAALSRRQIEEAPGLSLLAAVVPCDPKKFAEGYEAARESVSRQKALHAALSFAELPPVLERCAYSDASADAWQPKQENGEPGRWISADLVLRRQRSYEDEAELKRGGLDIEKQVGTTKLALADDVNHLRGAIYDSSYLGFIHIDANGLGERLKQIAQGERAIDELYRVSRHIRDAGLSAYRAGIQWVVENVTQLRKKVIYKDRKTKVEYLPFRHLLLAGDDLNFLSEGSIAIDQAALLCSIFVTELQKETLLKNVTACAGVALSRAHAPLYHLYELAKESCDEAKRASKRGFSALDWRLLYDEGMKTPASLRPYPLEERRGTLSYQVFRKGILSPLQNQAEEQRGPIQALASVLHDPLQAQQEVDRLQPRMRKELRDLLGDVSKALGTGGLFKNAQSPLVDAVQLLDLSYNPEAR